MRRKYDKKFKAQVALAAIHGEKTIQELAKEYKVHPNMIALWKKQLMENAAEVFDSHGKEKAAEEAEKKQDELLRQIGMLQVEKEFLKKKYKEIYGTEPPQ